MDILISIFILYSWMGNLFLYLKKDLDLPLPSYSTLCRYITKLDFQPGMLTNVFSLMSKKEKLINLRIKTIALLMDEMDIQPALEYDVSPRLVA